MRSFAEGWQRQRGDIFGFGNFKESPLALASMDQDKLHSAPINNLDAERSVGSINYELSIRGAKHLESASSAHVLAKSSHLIEGKPIEKKFRQMERQKVMPAIVEEWERQQAKLSKDGLSAKELANRATDQRRNADLQKLKTLGGPFSSSAEVKLFAASDLHEEDKVARLYLEVRLARDSCVSFPKNSDIFRLLKSYKKLSSQAYCDNLVIYFEKITFRNRVDMEDFETALDQLE